MVFRREILKGTLDLLILSLLKEKESYGYEIISRLGKLTDEFFVIKEGSLYPALHRLEKGKYLEGFWKMSEKKPRKYYRITAKGLEQLQNLENEWHKYIEAVGEILGGSEHGKDS